ncbi:MAG: GH3 auxin-responsive promoter family protein [Prevotellaceae bacterium]|jgi:hypothetical protein|nr:GH3 auxin-responsive promoter family protein [Prevotellaceae bacterium]
MNPTRVIAPFFQHRLRRIDSYATRPDILQQQVLDKLLRQAANTEWGQRYNYRRMTDYESYRNHVPIQTYEDIKPYVERMMGGEPNILWPNTVKWFAKSSGTTNDTSKFIPVSAEGLQDIHYRGGADAVALYLRQNPASRFFSGKGLILGGSLSPALDTKHIAVGDLSAILIKNVHPAVNLIRVPRQRIALMSDWETKIEAIANATMHSKITSLSGVPSWMLVVIKRVLEKTGASRLDKIWPDLEVFFHGGVSFSPYRDQYRQFIASPQMHYVETYNASEGYFGTQSDLLDPAMLLMIDYGIFYEFIPLEDVGSEHPRAYSLTEIETGRNYAIVISTSCGLWRYLIGDTVRFTSTHPYKFVITGRTKHFINAFGEELIIDNAEQGLAATCRATGAQVAEYSAAPVFMDENGKCRHQWLIEFAVVPDSLLHFARLLDEELRKLNSDYDAKRSKDIALQPLEVIVARKGLFHDWLQQKGKLGGQHKVPRLSNTRRYIEEMLLLNE